MKTEQGHEAVKNFARAEVGVDKVCLERVVTSVLWHREIWCTTIGYRTEISQADLGAVLKHLQHITRWGAVASHFESFLIIFAAEISQECFLRSLAGLHYSFAGGVVASFISPN